MEKGNELIEAFWIEQGGKPHLKEDISFYESDWNMLMPVVEKWNSLSQRKQDELPNYLDLDNSEGWRAWSYRYVDLTTDINYVRDYLIENIKWYNANKKN